MWPPWARRDVISGDKLYRVDAQQIMQRASLLQVYLCDEQKELQALYALQALMVDMEQSSSGWPLSSLSERRWASGLDVEVSAMVLSQIRKKKNKKLGFQTVPWYIF